MSKINRTLIIDFILFAVFSVIMFVAPFDKNLAFWLAYAFSSIAILSQVYFIKIAFQNGNDVKSKFYGFPIARISTTYLFAQVIAGLVFTLLSTVLNINITWLSVIVYVVLIAYVAIGTITADSIRNEISRQDTKLKQTVQVMRDIQSKMAPIMSLCDESCEKEINSLIEEIKYSDPVTSEGNELIEYQLKEIIDDIQKSLIEGNTNQAIDLSRKAKGVLIERNRLCKLNK